MFEWDARKAGENLAKHGVAFDEAATVFADPDALDGPDVRHSDAEARFLRLGRSVLGRVLMVAYTLRSSGNGETIRIISARRASRKERTAYRIGAKH
ncbi:MAG: BrnT family toxin [Vicinamibacterales bacterium]